MIRTFAAASLSLVLLSGAALADQCQDDVAKIDNAITSEEIDTDVRAQLEDMKSQAVQLCGAGNTDEGLAVASEALALIETK